MAPDLSKTTGTNFVVRSDDLEFQADFRALVNHAPELISIAIGLALAALLFVQRQRALKEQRT